MALVQPTKFNITEKPGPMGIVVEATGMTIYAKGDGWTAKKNITYNDDIVDVTVIMRGFTGQKYSLTMTLNEVSKEIKGTLREDGITKVTKTYPLTDFKLQL